MNCVIAVDGNLTSFVFYNEIIARLHDYFAENNQARILFDFSRVKLIDPLVLPNLLCAGFWITKHRGIPAKIFVPGNSEFQSLRSFLDRTGFVKFAQEYGLFEFDESIAGDLQETGFRTTLNRLELFQIAYKPQKEKETGKTSTELQEIDTDKTKDIAWSRLKESFGAFINEFLQKSTDQYILEHKTEISSDLLSFCRELIENALLHGRSFCFLNMQYSSAYGKQIKLSISDCGMGFKRSLNMDRSRSLQALSLQEQLKEMYAEGEREELKEEIGDLLDGCYPLSQREEKNDVARLSQYPYLNSELEGIIYGLLSRRNKPYGLYNIHRKIVHVMGGTIRVHSNDTQLILSQRMAMPLSVCETPEALLAQLANDEYAANVRTGLTFKGTHIEMELKLERREDEQ